MPAPGLAALLLAGVLWGCEPVDPAALAVNTLEAVARSACEAADNCRNLCPNGSSARAPGYHCAGNP